MFSGHAFAVASSLSHSRQVYDNNLRVPFFIRGPGIPPGQQVTALTQFADLAPTLLQLAGAKPSDMGGMDGRSFAHLVAPSVPAPSRPWKTVHLTTYQSIYPQHCEHPGYDASTQHDTNPIADPVSGGRCTRHSEDDATNTHRSLRILNATHNLLFAEFTDVSVPDNWDFPEV